MRLVIIESPYAGAVKENEDYLAQCVKDCLSKGEAPFASHGFYTQYLDDTNSEERAMGMQCGFNWMRKADLIAVYTDHGVSSGMLKGIKVAQDIGIPIEFREIKGLVQQGRVYVDRLSPQTKADIHMVENVGRHPIHFIHIEDKPSNEDGEEQGLRDIAGLTQDKA